MSTPHVVVVGLYALLPLHTLTLSFRAQPSSAQPPLPALPVHEMARESSGTRQGGCEVTDEGWCPWVGARQATH